MKALLISMMLVVGCFATEYRICHNFSTSITEDGLSTTYPKSGDMTIGLSFSIEGGALIISGGEPVRIGHYMTYGEGKARFHEFRAGALSLAINYNASVIILESKGENISHAVNYTCEVITP